MACFVTMNTSGKTQLLENADRFLARGTRTFAILNQGNWQWRKNIADLQSALWKSGWKCGVAGAVAGPTRGASAGTAVIVARSVGFDKVFATLDHGIAWRRVE